MGVVSGPETQQATAATHDLESRGQASSACLNVVSHDSNSRTGEPRSVVIRVLETQRATAATHGLESRGQASSAGLKRSQARQPLTNWTAEDRRRQRA